MICRIITMKDKIYPTNAKEVVAECRYDYSLEIPYCELPRKDPDSD